MKTQNTAADTTTAIATIDAIADNAQATPSLFLLAVAVRSKSDTLTRIIADVQAGNWALLLTWLNTDNADQAKLAAWTKANIQAVNGRYASKTHTIKLAGQTWAWLNRPADDISAAERKDLTAKLTAKGITNIPKDAAIAVLKQALTALSYVADNAELLKQASVTVPALSEVEPVAIKAYSDATRALINEAKIELKKISDQKKEIKKGLSELDAAQLNKVNPDLASELHAMPLATADQVDKAHTLVNAAKDAVKLGVTVTKVKDLPKTVTGVLRTQAETKTNAANHTLDFALTRQDFDLSEQLVAQVRALVDTWVVKHDQLTAANAQLVAAKRLYSMALTLERELGAKPTAKTGS